MKTNDEVRRHNLEVAIKRFGSASRLAEAAGTSSAYLSQIKNRTPDSKTGSPKTMGDTLARRIEAALSEPYGWMDTDHEVQVTRTAPRSGVQIEHALLPLPPGFMRVRGVEPDDPGFTQIKKVKIKVQAGITGFQVEPDYYEGETQGVPTEWIQKTGLAKEALMAIVVRGESMEPSLYDGDIIVVNSRDTAPVSGNVYVINYEGEAVVKRMIRDAGQWWLSSDNADQRRYHRQLCKGAHCIIIGRVIRKESTRI